MSTLTEHAADWDAQRETLSAHLDGRLSAQEDVALRRHLVTCSRCREELNELNQTVALLRALPPPALPRSFALPTHVEPHPAPAQLPATRARQARHNATWPHVAQWAGGLVAAAGLIVGIVGIIGQAPLATQRSTGSAASSLAPQQTAHDAASAAAGNGESSSTPAHTEVAGTAASRLPAAPTVVLFPTATRTASINRAVAPVSDGTGQPLPSLPIAGAALLVVGATTYAVGTRSRRRQR